MGNHEQSWKLIQKSRKILGDDEKHATIIQQVNENYNKSTGNHENHGNASKHRKAHKIL